MSFLKKKMLKLGVLFNIQSQPNYIPKCKWPESCNKAIWLEHKVIYCLLYLSLLSPTTYYLLSTFNWGVVEIIPSWQRTKDWGVNLALGINIFGSLRFHCLWNPADKIAEMIPLGSRKVFILKFVSLCSDVCWGRITGDGQSMGFRAQKTWIQTLSLFSLFLMRIIKESRKAVGRINWANVCKAANSAAPSGYASKPGLIEISQQVSQGRWACSSHMVSATSVHLFFTLKKKCWCGYSISCHVSPDTSE